VGNEVLVYTRISDFLRIAAMKSDFQQIAVAIFMKLVNVVDEGILCLKAHNSITSGPKILSASNSMSEILEIELISSAK
jgi:hypothetical protein